MSMFDAGWNGFPQQEPEPQPEPQPEQEPQPEPQPEQEPQPEPVQEPEPQPEPEPVRETRPEPEPEPEPGPVREPKPKPKTETKTEPWTVDRIRRVHAVLDALRDEKPRRVAAGLFRVPGDDVDRLALHVLKGGLAAPVRLLAQWKGEPDPLRRAIMVGADMDRDMRTVRLAARIMLLLEPAWSDVKPNGSRPQELQYAVASHAGDVDVDALGGLL